jgi:hypothetical protein
MATHRNRCARLYLWIVASVLCGGQLMSASDGPVVSVSSLGSAGVILLPYRHPEFDRPFGTGRAAEYDPILPYTVVIRNDTDREVIAYSVIWFCTGADGWVKKQLRTTFNFSSLRPGDNLPPHSMQIVSSGLLDLEGGGHNPAGMMEAMNEQVRFFFKQAAIRISLEAVLFDDGTATGPDHGGWIDRWRAELEADQEVMTRAAQSSMPNARDVLREFSNRALAIAKGKGEFVADVGLLPIMAERTSDYSECLDLMRGYFALKLLDDLDKSGESALLQVRSTLKSKRYPSVHRKEFDQ